MSDTDKHGQPLVEAFAWSRLHDSRMDELIGICRGVLADGVLVAEEVAFILDWLNRNPPLQKTEFGRKLSVDLQAAVTDGRLSPEDEEELVTTLIKFTGGVLPATGEASHSTSLPLCDPRPAISFLAASFCFTGKFQFGSRLECEAAVVHRGAIIHKAPNQKTSFVVIGDLGSRDWIHSSMGRKIEKAVDLRAKGHAVRIVAEDHWADSVRRIPVA